MDGIAVWEPAGGPIRRGAVARAELRVFASASWEAEAVDVYLSQADGALVRVDTVAPVRQGAQVLAVDLPLTVAGRATVRAHMRRVLDGIFPSACGTTASTARHDDQDDLVFDVEP